MSSSFTLKIDANEQAVIRAFFNQHDFEFDDVAHAFWRALGPDIREHFTDLENSCCKGKRHQLGESSLERLVLRDPLCCSAGAAPKAKS